MRSSPALATGYTPPEVIKRHKDVKDWRNLVGTGPYELEHVLEGRSLTFTRNPDYWGIDEKKPEKRLPYIDEITAHVMPNQATRLAALRTGRIDFLGTVGDSQISIDKINSLRRTNPEIALWPFRSNNPLVFFYLNEPPNDTDVGQAMRQSMRQALQLALDNETIARTYWSGYAEPIPLRSVTGIYFPFEERPDEESDPTPQTSVTGIYFPFEEWPEGLKQYYSYDTERAEQLLASPNYGFTPLPYDLHPYWYTPRQITLDFAPFASLDYAERATADWAAIGIEVEINVLTYAKYYDRLVSDTYEFMDSVLQIDQNNLGFEDVRGAVRKATAQLQPLWIANPTQFNAHQPWVRGYMGENSLGMANIAGTLSRLWIDQELKK